MRNNFERIRKSTNWGSEARCLNGLVVMALLLSVLAPAAVPTPQAPPRIQPLLLELAAQDPDQTISVIVQKTAKDAGVETQVAVLGGAVTADLHIINAFAAEMQAQDAVQLARAAGVRWVSLDAPIESTGDKPGRKPGDGTIASSSTANIYSRAIGADKVWTADEAILGQGVTVAVIDSGLNSAHPDFGSRVLADVEFSSFAMETSDNYGHGTFVAGVVAGDGTALSGRYIGIAPKANLVNVKVATGIGAALESDVVAGLQWVYENQARYNIRVVNVSLNSSVAQSYHTSPLDAAVESLWFNGIVVVTAAGNAGQANLYPPANDPFVITVGATDDMGTASIRDDIIPSFSAYGVTEDGFAKPDLVAPGKNLVAPSASKNSLMAMLHPNNVIDGAYFKMSGTSAAAPVVSGAVALLLQDEPELSPDQVKYRLMATAVNGKKQWPGYDAQKAGAGYLNVYNAVNGTTTQSANTGTAVSNLLTTSPDGILGPSVSWNSVSWNSVSWNSVSWNSVSWNSVSWNSVSWNSDYWGP